MKKFLLFLGVMMAFTAARAQKIAELVAASPDHTILTQVITETGLTAFYMGEGPITLFAPTDAAFESMPQDLLDAYLADPTGVLRDILFYHTLPGNFGFGAFSDGQTVTTVFQNQSVMMTVDGTTIHVNDALITAGNFNASNGRIHVIDAVLMPQTTTVYDYIAESADLSDFTSALNDAGLDATLEAPGRFTVFAPTNAAFDALPEGFMSALLTQPEDLLADILNHHVLDTTLLAEDLEDGSQLLTLLGEALEVSLDDGTIIVGNAALTIADEVTINGVVHVIDAVNLPAGRTLYDALADHEDLVQVRDFVDLAALEDTLRREEPLTFFAPTDAAFAALPEGVLDILSSDPEGALTELLLEHLTEGIFTAASLGDGEILTSLGGAELIVSNDGTTLEINGAELMVTDILTTNGVLHVLDAVIATDGLVCMEFAGEPLEDFNDTFGGAPVAENGICPTNQITDFEARAGQSYVVSDFATGSTYTFSICEGPGAGAWDAELSVYLPDGTLLAIVQDCSITWTAPVDGSYVIGIQEVGFCGAESPNTETDNGYPTLSCESLNTVFTAVAESPEHELLTSLLITTALTEELNSDNFYTLFAPTDAAFDMLPEGLFDALLADPFVLLADILNYHILEVEAPANDLLDGSVWQTALLGQEVEISIVDGDLFVNGALITTADITTDNGVVHVIDAVLIPTNARTVYDALSTSGVGNTMKTIVDLAGMEDLFTGPDAHTLFAPTDVAFSELPEGVLDSLLAAPVDTLVKFVEYHLLSGHVLSSALADGPITTVGGFEATVSHDGPVVQIDGHSVTAADDVAINGVVHYLDGVLLYPGFSIDAENPEALSRWAVYPNPAVDLIHLDFSLIGSSEMSVRVINTIGQTVFVKEFGKLSPGSFREKLDLGFLAPGVYLVGLQLDDHRVSKKVSIGQ